MPVPAPGVILRYKIKPPFSVIPSSLRREGAIWAVWARVAWLEWHLTDAFRLPYNMLDSDKKGE